MFCCFVGGYVFVVVLCFCLFGGVLLGVVVVSGSLFARRVDGDGVVVGECGGSGGVGGRCVGLSGSLDVDFVRVYRALLGVGGRVLVVLDTGAPPYAVFLSLGALLSQDRRFGVKTVYRGVEVEIGEGVVDTLLRGPRLGHSELAVLEAVARGYATIKAISGMTGYTDKTVSKYLRMLREKGLVRRDGWISYSLTGIGRLYCEKRSYGKPCR